MKLTTSSSYRGAKIVRHEVPADDQPHPLFVGQILHVATRSADVVEIWAEGERQTKRTFRVVGTNEEWNGELLRYVATSIVPGGVAGVGMVWHLLEEEHVQEYVPWSTT